jgi:hypothetical protein
MRLSLVSVVFICLAALISGSSAEARELGITFATPVAPPLSACSEDQAPADDHGLYISPALTADLITADGVSAPDAGAQGQRPVAFETSEAYQTRAKIHKYASFATLPLLGSELIVGESLYTSLSNGQKSAHIAIGAGIVGLFAVNTVTGVWNLWESRTNPAGRTKRFAHGLLMLASDAGFVATSMSGPGNGRNTVAATFDANASRHRTIAITSISLATAGYLIMLVGGH